MDAVHDFEDLLELLTRHGARYLIIGGLAFVYHAKPRYTKDMDLWIDPDEQNVEATNRALAEFGSPHLLAVGRDQEILQIGIAPNRIDLLRSPASAGGPEFAEAWRNREVGAYGRVEANWIHLDDLLEIKSHIEHPRHQEDARVLRLIQAKRGR